MVRNDQRANTEKVKGDGKGVEDVVKFKYLAMMKIADGST